MFIFPSHSDSFRSLKLRSINKYIDIVWTLSQCRSFRFTESHLRHCEIKFVKSIK